MKNNILLMNFSHVYEYENFYKDEDFRIINFSEVEGTNCYCDNETASIIRKYISSFDVEGVHFIDSGNYHYVSSFWLEKIKKPFILVVMDNHTDMQEPAFGDILSCGSWIHDVISKNSYLKKVVLIGPPKSSYTSLNDKIIPIYEGDKNFKEKLEEIELLKKEYSIYISIDKDVLSEKYAATSWSQGNMGLDMLEKFISYFYNDKTIGIDVCGECPLNCEMCTSQSMTINNSTNKEILNYIESINSREDVKELIPN